MSSRSRSRGRGPIRSASRRTERPSPSPHRRRSHAERSQAAPRVFRSRASSRRRSTSSLFAYLEQLELKKVEEQSLQELAQIFESCGVKAKWQPKHLSKEMVDALLLASTSHLMNILAKQVIEAMDTKGGTVGQVGNAGPVAQNAFDKACRAQAAAVKLIARQCRAQKPRYRSRSRSRSLSSAGSRKKLACIKL